MCCIGSAVPGESGRQPLPLRQHAASFRPRAAALAPLCKGAGHSLHSPLERSLPRLPLCRRAQCPKPAPCPKPARPLGPAQDVRRPHRLDGQRLVGAAVLDHVAIRSVHDAGVSASDRVPVAGSVAAGEATPAGRSPAGTLARLGDGNAGSAAEGGWIFLPLDPILRPNIAPTFALPPATLVEQQEQLPDD